MLSEIANRDAALSVATVAYFQDRLRTRLYDLVIGELENYKARGMTQAQLATRIGKRADQISRWLSGPGNWTLDTVSDLLLGISGGELRMSLDRPAEAPGRNFRQPAWLEPSRPERFGIHAIQNQHAISDTTASATITVGGDAVSITSPTTVTVYAEI